MAAVKMIPADDLCTYHQLEDKFIKALHSEGLISISIVDKQYCIAEDDLPGLERMIHLYQDLDINVEGIASITYLLQRLDSLQQELLLVRNKLSLYEEVLGC